MCRGEQRHAGARAGELDSAVRALHACGREAWPGVQLAEEVFTQHLLARLPPGGGLAELASALHAADLYLACAGAQGNGAALAALEQLLVREATRAVERIVGGAALADEVLQRVRSKLFVAAEGAPRIAEYSGRGPLAHWLRATAVRVALDLRRASGPSTPLEEVPEALTAAHPDPELDFIKAHHRPEFEAALREALGRLTPQERNVLRLYVLEGSTLEEIGGFYRVNRSTVSRWLAKAREQVLRDMRRTLAERLRLGRAELESFMGLFHSRLESSLSGVLGSKVP